MKTLIVIPTYNEALNIEKLINTIYSTLTASDFSILIVDDSSTDGTFEKVEQLKSKYKTLLSIQRPEKLGLASAYIDGFKYGLNKGFDAFIQMDADFSHNPDYLNTMIENLNTYDVVIASRNIKGGSAPDWGLLRHIISKGGSIYSKIILNCPINDLTGGFNAWKKEVLEKINLDNIISTGYVFQIEMKYKAYKNNFKIKEFPIVFPDRKQGKSKMSKAIFFEALINVIKLRFSK